MFIFSKLFSKSLKNTSSFIKSNKLFFKICHLTLTVGNQKCQNGPTQNPFQTHFWRILYSMVSFLRGKGEVSSFVVITWLWQLPRLLNGITSTHNFLTQFKISGYNISSIIFLSVQTLVVDWSVSVMYKAESYRSAAFGAALLSFRLGIGRRPPVCCGSSSSSAV